mgnify:CR=1 FL=1
MSVAASRVMSSMYVLLAAAPWLVFSAARLMVVAIIKRSCGVIGLGRGAVNIGVSLVLWGANAPRLVYGKIKSPIISAIT